MLQLDDIQAELRACGIAAWLFYDHHHRDPIAYRILGLAEAMMATRRWYYLIPAQGAPRKLVHRIESGALDAVPGTRALYSRWSELDAALARLVAGLDGDKIAMQYTPACALPAITLADAGTVEQIRALGCEVVSSGDLISRFDATWTAAMLANHAVAGRAVDAAIQGAFARVRQHVDQRACLTEFELQHWIAAQLAAAGMVGGEPPIVAVNAHAGDPHYQPSSSGSARIQPGDLLLLDVWASVGGDEGCYYDVTWMGYCLRPGESAVPAQLSEIFAVVRGARDAAIALSCSGAIASSAGLRGFQVDQAARAVIDQAGLGEYFVHRTGHSLGRDVHATGANMDDFETRDQRRILPGTAFTIEPGVYCPTGRPLGLRSEVNIYVDGGGRAAVTGPIQGEIVRI
ncbi:MAG: M24 family metallopeptidase [Terriglobales bacterium]